ncbi:MAG: L-seryl-tRNA(Sec) selenium transferase [Anaerolineales bacterium]|nr:L-seryl-tRNA(Sec) selenium transferase [Anaerolineales bacterium]
MNSLSQLPSVDQVLSSTRGVELVEMYGHDLTVEAIRSSLDQVRQDHLKEGYVIPDQDGILDAADNLLALWLKPSLFPVLNATGVIIHTNLGRAPLSENALMAVREVGQNYSTLEFDLESGGRGSRLVHAESLFQQLLGIESALVVNNNASAVLLMLTVLTQGKKVIISRSQLVEIGGGFRIPEVLRHSGTELVEVGTTNKVHLSDFEKAFTEDTAAVMRAHSSNYAIVGFTSEPDIKDIITSAHEQGLWFFDDLGSGALLDSSPFGLKHEPMVQESLAAGADLVCFSGDKLLGGPQGGIILGRKDLIDQLKIHPLARAIRADKMALAALSATMEHYIKGEALEKIPVWQMISTTEAEIKSRAENWKKTLGLGEVIESQSMVGGGSLPGETLPTWIWAISTNHPQSLLAELRNSSPAIISRIENDLVVFDPRTILPQSDSDFIQAFNHTWSGYEK